MRCSADLHAGAYRFPGAVSRPTGFKTGDNRPHNAARHFGRLSLLLGKLFEQADTVGTDAFDDFEVKLALLPIIQLLESLSSLDLTPKAIANPRFGRAPLHTWPAAIRGMVHA